MYNGFSTSSIPSLDNALRRINAIENELSRIASSQPATPLQAQNAIDKTETKDFQKILEKVKSTQTKVEDKVEAKVEDKAEKNTAVKPRSKSDDISVLIEKYADRHDIDPDFVKAVIKQESGFNPTATSHCGAMGLMQLMPGTAKELGVSNAYDPEQNIGGGVAYLKKMMSKFDNDPKLALAAYNAGPGAVSKFGGIPPYKETQNYVKNVLKAYETYKERAS